MYSVVMMMVLSSSPETVAFGGRRGGCEGCYGGCAGNVCNGGWGGCDGCNGGRGGMFRRGGRGHGCDGGCWGGNGCHGGGRKHGRGNGCCGCMGQSSCMGYGGGCWGGAMPVGGCWGGQAVGGGCWGGQPMMAAPMAPPQGGQPAAQPEAAPQPRPGAMAPVAGTIVVSLPADAKVSFDGVATSSTSDVRRFATPEMVAGSVANYTLTAEIVREGQKLTTTQVVSVKAGETLEVSLPVEAFTTSVVRN